MVSLNKKTVDSNSYITFHTVNIQIGRNREYKEFILYSRPMWENYFPLDRFLKKINMNSITRRYLPNILFSFKINWAIVGFECGTKIRKNIFLIKNLYGQILKYYLSKLKIYISHKYP